MPAPRIGRPRSLEEREQQAHEEALSRERAEVTIELSPYEIAKLEKEKRDLQDALAGTRPAAPVKETAAPEHLNPRVKPAPEPEPVAVEPVEPVVNVPEAQLAEATARQRTAHESLARAQAEVEQADAVLVQVKADHAAALAEQKLQHHHAILKPALARAQRQKAAFLQLFNVYGGASSTNMGKGTTHGPLAKYARTIPVGDAQRRERLGELYREAGVLMERIRLGYQAAFRAVEACEKALTIGGIGDYANLRVELAGAACAEAIPHDPDAVEQACVQLLAAIKTSTANPVPRSSPIPIRRALSARPAPRAWATRSSCPHSTKEN